MLVDTCALAILAYATTELRVGDSISRLYEADDRETLVKITEIMFESFKEGRGPLGKLFVRLSFAMGYGTTVDHVHALNHICQKYPSIRVVANSGVPRCTIFETQGKLFVVFRGSVSLVDWFYNFMLFQRPVNGCRVHQGFYRTLTSRDDDQDGESVQDVVEQCIRRFPDHNVYLTGHSLGGALAQLYAFLNEVPRPLVVHSFASPRVGDFAFKQYMEDHSLIRTTRVCLANDMATGVSAISMPFCRRYHHVTEETIVLKRGRVIRLNPWTRMFSCNWWRHLVWFAFPFSPLAHRYGLYYERIYSHRLALRTPSLN